LRLAIIGLTVIGLAVIGFLRGIGRIGIALTTDLGRGKGGGEGDIPAARALAASTVFEKRWT
jgi:hypothetical protein